jgi:hypothetical protein
MKNNYLAKQKRQFKGLCKKISKNWDRLSTNQRESLLARFRRLYGNLKSAFARPALRKMMGAAAVVLMTAGEMQAQTFAAPVQNPFNLARIQTSPLNIGAAYGSIPTFVDIDNDGDYDIFSANNVYNNDIVFFENTGTASVPSFAAQEFLPFGLDTTGFVAYSTELVDIDGDGDFDLFGAYGNSISYSENTGTANIPDFDGASQIPFGLTVLQSNYLHNSLEFADLDNDGDYDLLSAAVGRFYYYENTGTATTPAFAAPAIDTFGLTGISINIEVTDFHLLDWDNDGDLDLFSGSRSGSFYYYENTGTASAPDFAAPAIDTFGLTDITILNSYTYGSTVSMVDIDNDGDLDLMSGEFYANFFYYRNDEIVATEEYLQKNITFNIYPNPVSEQLNIELAQAADYQISVTDLTGREIYNSFIQADNNLQLSTQAWPAGLYLLQVRDEEGRVETKKVVKR